MKKYISFATIALLAGFLQAGEIQFFLDERPLDDIYNIVPSNALVVSDPYQLRNHSLYVWVDTEGANKLVHVGIDLIVSDPSIARITGGEIYQGKYINRWVGTPAPVLLPNGIRMNADAGNGRGLTFDFAANLGAEGPYADIASSMLCFARIDYEYTGQGGRTDMKFVLNEAGTVEATSDGVQFDNSLIWFGAGETAPVNSTLNGAGGGYSNVGGTGEIPDATASFYNEDYVFPEPSSALLAVMKFLALVPFTRRR